MLQYFGHLMQIWLIGKDSDARNHWEQEKKGTTEDKMVGWHYQLNAHEFKQTPGDSEGQGSLACCSPWDHKESDRLSNWLTTTKAQRITRHTLMMKAVQNMSTDRTYLNIIKAIYNKPTANIILTVKTESMPSRIRTKTRVPILTTIIQHSFESPSYGNQR